MRRKSPIPPLALALIAGFVAFALAGRSRRARRRHGRRVALPDLRRRNAPRGHVRILRIRGSGTSCAEVRKVLAASFATDLQSIEVLVDGFKCGIDPPQSVSLLGPTGGCKRSETAGVQFDMRFRGRQSVAPCDDDVLAHHPPPGRHHDRCRGRRDRQRRQFVAARRRRGRRCDPPRGRAAGSSRSAGSSAAATRATRRSRAPEHLDARHVIHAVGPEWRRRRGGRVRAAGLLLPTCDRTRRRAASWSA